MFAVSDLISERCVQRWLIQSDGGTSLGGPFYIVKRDTITTPFGRHEWVTVSFGSILGWKVRLQVLPRLLADIPVETNGVVQVKYTNQVQICTDLNHVRPYGSGGKVCF